MKLGKQIGQKNKTSINLLEVFLKYVVSITYMYV